MALDWDNIEIIAEDEEIIKTSDSDIINMDACDRMIIFSGQPGPQGPVGPQGPPGYGAEWGNIGGTLSAQTDLQSALNAKADTADLGTMSAVNDAPSDDKTYGRKNGEWAEVTGGGSAEWGDITGTLSDQTDLQSALNAKANTADLGALASKDAVDYSTDVTNKPTLGALSSLDSIDYTSNKLTNKPTLGSLAAKSSVDYTTEVTNKPTLGTMAEVNDAPSDGKEYARKNGLWSEVTGGGGGSAEWGDITGTLSDQTDLQNALDAKADETDLGDLASLNSIDYTSAYLTNKPTLGSLASKNSVDYDTEVTNKPTLGALASQDTVDYDTDITNLPTLGSLASLSSIDYTSAYLTNKPTLGTMSSVDDAPSDNKEYARKNGAWSEVPTPSAPEWGDITGTLSDQTDLNTALGAKADLATEIMYFTSQTVNAATNAEIFRITNANITTDTVVLECTFADPAKIKTNVSWTSYSGYIAFSGTCTAGTTANVTLGKKGN